MSSRTRSRIAVAAAVATMAAVTFFGASARGAVLPPLAEAVATAKSVGNDAGSVERSDPAFASASNEVDTPDLAAAAAQATVGGPLRARSSVSAVSGTNEPTAASATATWSAPFLTTGTDPGSGVPIDFTIKIDGSLGYANNNSGATANQIRSNVALRVRALGAASSTSIFDGSAELATVANDQAPALIRTGDWAGAGRDGDFETVDGCGRFSCETLVDADIAIAGGLEVGFGEVFAVEFELSSSSFVFAGFETEAMAAFFDTASVVLSSTTPGITVSQVPLPAAAWLFAAPLLALGAAMRARRPNKQGAA